MVRDEEKELSETDAFWARFSDPDYLHYQKGYKDAFDHLNTWIEEIGKQGLEVCVLRHEDEAKGLPPKLIKDKNLKFLQTYQPKLRLYCVPFPPGIIILCGGGIKTSQKNEDSPDILPHLRLAKNIARELTRKLIHKEIWIEGNTLNGDLELWLPG